MTICIAGKNRCAKEAIAFAMENGYQVVHLPNKRPGHEPFDVPCSIVDLPTLYEIEDLILYSLESDHIFKPHLFKTRHLYNFHFSLLPKYRGCHTTAWQIRNGEMISGVTMHVIDKGIDTGPIVDRHGVTARDLTAAELYDTLQSVAVDMFRIHLGSKGLKSKPQDETLATYYPLGSFDFKQRINWNAPPFETAAQINSLIFPAFQVPEIDGFRISRAKERFGYLTLDLEE